MIIYGFIFLVLCTYGRTGTTFVLEKINTFCLIHFIIYKFKNLLNYFTMDII